MLFPTPTLIICLTMVTRGSANKAVTGFPQMRATDGETVKALTPMAWEPGA